MMEKKWDLSEKRKFTAEDLREIMRKLLGPDGCPWDRAQTHTSIRKNLIEEAYETVDAIDTGASERIKDELGDVLLQVYFHAEMAEKAGEFSFEDITDNISRKLISRHTHIFGNDRADTPDAVLSVWDKNKMLEKNQSTFAQTLLDLPAGLPSLMKSDKIQKRAAKAGFDWPDAKGAREKIDEELSEIEFELIRDKKISYAGVDPGKEPDRFSRLESEIGDLFFAAVNFSRLLGVDSEVALNRANDCFIRRFSAMEDQAKQDGMTLNSLNPEKMDRLWEEVKQREKKDENR